MRKTEKNPEKKEKFYKKKMFLKIRKIKLK